MTAPIRTCVGCGRKAAKHELHRLVAREGRVVPGAASAPGRGAYTCRRLHCFERARSRRAFSRSLRQSLTIDPSLTRLYTGAS